MKINYKTIAINDISRFINRIGGAMRGLCNLKNTVMLSAALTAGAWTLTSCGPDNEPLPPPPEEHKPATYKITINYLTDLNMSDILSKASAFNKADSVILDMSNIGVGNTDFIRIIEYVNMSKGDYKNIRINWADGSLFAGGNGVVLSLDNWDKMGRPPLSVSPSGAKFNLATGEKPSDFGFYSDMFNPAGPGDIVIANAAEFPDKCKSAAAGKRIEIRGNISTDIENAVYLKNAIKAGAGFFIGADAGLEFTVGADKNLERLGIDVIAAACMGQSVINIRVKTNPATNRPFITVFNQGVLDAAYTAATVGVSGSGIPGKASYAVRFIGEDGKLINPVISGTRVSQEMPDSLYAKITKLEARYGGYTWDIMEKSVGKIVLDRGAPLVRSPTEKIDFYYPIPSLAGKYAQTISQRPQYWIRPTNEKITMVNAGDFVNKTVISGPLAGQLADKAFWYVIGLGASDRKFTLVIHNVDLLGWCYDGFTYLSYDLVGPDINGRAEYALRQITKVNPEMQFLDSNGQPSTRLPLLQGYMAEKGPLPVQQFPMEYVLYLVDGIVK